MKRLEATKVVTGLAMVVLIGIMVVFWFQQPKIGFVKTPELVYGYLGTREAKADFEELKSKMLANLDTLKRHHSDLLMEYKGLSQDSPGKVDLESEIRRSQGNIRNYELGIDEKIYRQDEELMTGVLNQINSYVMDFGKANGYDYIFGTTESGSLLYATDADDLTDEILEGLNDNYSGVE